MTTFRVFSVNELLSWVDAHIPHGIVRGILFTGDRTACLDEAVGLEVGGEIVGIATIAPDGEQMSGEPTIVAIYVRHEFRRQSLGRNLLIAAIDRCRQRELVPVRIDALTTPALKIAEDLPEAYRQDITLRDMTGGGIFDDLFLT